MPRLSFEITRQKGWKAIWLECDSFMMVDIFNGILGGWLINGIGVRCGSLRLMIFKVSHIFKEDNNYADKLASFGVSSKVYT
ncbi:hypothetical protein Lal_00017713 [Lupinus albus]|nr:hypothetical protein Lal_00017713 [Lupinus albus]